MSFDHINPPPPPLSATLAAAVRHRPQHLRCQLPHVPSAVNCLCRDCPMLSTTTVCHQPRPPSATATMPDPGATNLEDLLVHAHDQLAYPGSSSRPCHSGGGYAIRFQEEQLAKAQARKDVDVSKLSLCPWRERLHPYPRTGNKLLRVLDWQLYCH